MVITQCRVVDLSSHYSQWTKYCHLQEWNRWGNEKVSSTPEHKCQADMGDKFQQKANFLASNEHCCSCALKQGWRSAGSSSGVSEIEESGNINGGLQTLNLSLPLQFNWDTLQLFLALSFKISSVCLCLVMDLLAGSGFEYIEMFFLQQKSAALLFSTSAYTLSTSLKTDWCSYLPVFLLIYSDSSWDVYSHGKFALKVWLQE